MDYPLSVSQAGSLRRCPQRWWWAYMDGLRPEHVKMPLWFGIGVHLALADWYLLGTKRGAHPAETWEEYCSDEKSTSLVNVTTEDGEKEFTSAQELGSAMMNGYVQHWGKDDHEHWIATEKDFAVKIPAWGQRIVRKGTKPLGMFRGVFDGVYRDMRTEEIWLKEHKTSRDNRTLHLPSDPQATRYLLVATKLLREQKLIGKHEEIVGIDYNFLQKKLPPEDVDENGVPLLKPKKADYIEAFEGNPDCSDARENMKLDELKAIADREGLVVKGKPSEAKREPLFLREQTYRTRGELTNALTGIQSELIYRDQIASGEIPVFKNPTRDCSWDCDFYRMCQLHEAGEDWEEYRDDKYVQNIRLNEEMDKKKAA